MKVQNVLSSKGSDVITVDPSVSVRDAVAVICKRRIGAVVVQNSDNVIEGMFSERDLIRGINEKGATVLDLTVDKVMTTDVQTCSRFDTVNDVMAMMTRRRFRHIPVVDSDELVGLISIGDAVKARIADAEHEAEALKEYIATS